MKIVNKYKAIDLFCGIGGLSFGLRKAGINVVAGVDIDASCKYAYEANNAIFINKSISEITKEEINNCYYGSDIKILVGCAPCQTFSKYTQKIANREKSQKWRLLDNFANKIQEIRPEIVSMENVPQLTKYNVFRDFIAALDRNGYNISYEVVRCVDYGIPQNRSRLVLLASLLGPIVLVPRTHTKSRYKTVRDSIGSLKEIIDGGEDETDPLHKSSRLSALNRRRIRQSKPGGSWYDWDEDIILDCHKKKAGKTFSSVYGRMEWDKPSPTITTQFCSFGTGRFGHPEQNRAISLREGALLQTFPRNYIFSPEGSKIVIKQISRHVGNAVPVRLAEMIGKSIIAHIKEYK